MADSPLTSNWVTSNIITERIFNIAEDICVPSQHFWYDDSGRAFFEILIIGGVNR